MIHIEPQADRSHDRVGLPAHLLSLIGIGYPVKIEKGGGMVGRLPAIGLQIDWLMVPWYERHLAVRQEDQRAQPGRNSDRDTW